MQRYFSYGYGASEPAGWFGGCPFHTTGRQMSATQVNGPVPGYRFGETPGNLPYESQNGAFPAKSSIFMFRKRFERIDWKRLASIDVDMVARNLDFLTLQEIVTNITFCNIESELNDSRAVDPNYVKLFRLGQLIIEYLLHSQEHLVNKVQELRGELNMEKAEHSKTQTEVEKLKAQVSDLKKELHQRKKIIDTQQHIMHTGSDSYNKCAYCSKAFMNASFLQAHLIRRHPELGRGQPEPIAPVQQPHPSLELVRQVEELRERLRLAELQMVDERNRLNEKQKLETSDKARIESKLYAEMEDWKREQLESHKLEMEKMRNMFTKELREVSGKLAASESALEEIKQMRNQGSMLGTIRDDVESEEVRKQQTKIEFLSNQLKQVEEDMQVKQLRQNKAWKKKFDDAARRHKTELSQMMEARIREMEQKLANDVAKTAVAEDLKRREAAKTLRSELEARDSKVTITQPPRQAAVQLEPPMRSGPSTVSVPSISAARTPPQPVVRQPSVDFDKLDNEEEVTDEEEEEEEGDKAEELEEEEIKEETPLPDSVKKNTSKLIDDEFMKRLKEVMPYRERLEAELKRNPDYLGTFREDCEEQLGFELDNLGVGKKVLGVDDKRQADLFDAMLSTRNQASTEYFDFFVIRDRCAKEVDKMASERLRQYQRSKSVSPKGARSQTARISTKSPRAKVYFDESPRTPLRDDVLSRPSAKSQEQRKQPKQVPKNLMEVPKEQVQKQMGPKPSPRGQSSSTGLEAAVSAVSNPDMTASLSTAGNTARSESQWDSDEPISPHGTVLPMLNATHPIPELRPRARTPPGAEKMKQIESGRLPTVASRSEKMNVDNDDEDDWDDVSEIKGFESLTDNPRPVKSQSTPLNSIQQRAQQIELQLESRKGTKILAGAVNTVPTQGSELRRKSSRQQSRSFSADSDNDSIESVSLIGDSDSGEQSKLRQVMTAPVKASFGARSAPTLSSNTLGSSAWGSGREVASSINTQKTAGIDDDDDWNVSDDDDE